MSKPNIPDVLDRFVAYYKKNPVWGSLHVVLDDGNVKDHFVRFCLDHACNTNDPEGYELAGILLTMSKTQRSRLPGVVHREVSR